MSIIEQDGSVKPADDEAVAELDEIVARQREAFLADPYPSLEERRELLGTLAGMVIGHRAEIEEAMSADFAVHPALATDLIEVLGVAGRAAYAAERLEDWMAPEERDCDPALYGTGRAFVQPQPKGVVGNIVPGTSPSTSPSDPWSRCSRRAIGSSSSPLSTRRPARRRCRR